MSDGQVHGAQSEARVHGAQVVVRTGAFEGDLSMLTDRLGFRVDAIFPADRPSTAIVSAHGLRVRLEAADDPAPVTIQLVVDEPGDPVTLPGGSRVECVPFERPYELPENRPALTISHDHGGAGIGRAGMRYRDLLPDRWGGRFVSSLISIPDGGPVPDYVHFHTVRFQLIFVKDGWVKVVYEDQGDPFVLARGDGVTQPPEIRHCVLEASPGLQVVEIGCPAEHETIADWSLSLPNGRGDSAREWDGQRFVRHVAAEASYVPWRAVGWEHRETGVGAATGGLAGVRVARPTGVDGSSWLGHDHEFAQLVVLRGTVTFEAEGREAERLGDGAAAAIPGGTRYRLVGPSADCELLDVTLPAVVRAI